MIGPWTVKLKLTKKVQKVQKEINALTMVDRAISWPELAATRNFSSAEVSQLFDKEWLCRYPWPKTVIHNNGNKFNALEFQELL